ncbi:MAG: hypothetical protein M3509_02400, partial [Chloroflexota bacterium]|nr:hypothetical protein [Chloroflexota bacterium]
MALPADLQNQAAARFAMTQAQVTALPLPEVASRIRAAVTADDFVGLALFVDLVPGRLAAMTDAATMTERGAADELRKLLATVRGRLREKYADTASADLHAKAVEMRSAAGSAWGKAGRRQRSERSLA